MRKWIIAFSLLAALLGLAACGQSTPNAHVQNNNLEEKLPDLLAYKWCYQQRGANNLPAGFFKLCLSDMAGL